MIESGLIQAVARRYLAVARSTLEMDVAWLSEHSGAEHLLHAVDGDSEPFGIAAGSILASPLSYCTRVLDGALPAVIPDARAEPAAACLPVTERLGIGSYVGAPVNLPDGTAFGMLCCVGRAPNPRLGASEARLLSALASSLGEDLARAALRQREGAIPRASIERAAAGEGLAAVVQPIVKLAEMRVVGVEALARFQDPPGRPDLWFARAAELGLGEALELSAIRAALALLPQLPDGVYLSVNASPDTLHGRGLHGLLAAADPRRVVIEITEHASVARYDDLLRELAALRELGVRVAVDDTGAGYASFRHILMLRPDIIKLDRDMVNGVDRDRAREGLVGALASFAESLGATVVAEGVETAGELDVLARVGIACGQGYYLARPGPLPLPAIGVSPTRQRLATARPLPGGDDFAAFVASQLAEVAAATGLEACFLNIRNPVDGTLEHRYVHDPAGLGIPAGARVPWTGSLCQRCQEAGLLWTADVSTDLPDAGVDPAVFGTFMSVPVLSAGGEEVVGTLCATGRARRYLSDRAISGAERVSRAITDRLARRGEQYDPAVPVSGGG
jgi:EAL domain-containing protein (putative c-di-GMP-specific phosphodiesterase class I)